MSGVTFSFRPFESSDRPACLSLFDTNCPAFFAPNERANYVALPDGWGPGMHRVDMEWIVA